MRIAMKVAEALVLVAALAACQGAQMMAAIGDLKARGPTYVGTWVNAAYNPHGGKVALTDDSMSVFDRDTDSTAALTSVLAVAVDWPDNNYHYFKVTATNPPAPAAYYLMRVSGDSATLEMLYTNSVYPMFINSSDPTYRMYNRR